VPSIAPITFGKPLTASNPVQTSLILLPDGHLMIFGAKSYNAFITLRVELRAVARPTSNFSHMDLKDKLTTVDKNYFDINTQKY